MMKAVVSLESGVEEPPFCLFKETSKKKLRLRAATWHRPPPVRKIQECFPATCKKNRYSRSSGDAAFS